MERDATIHSMTDLPCSVCEDWLHAYLEGETDAARAAAIAAHLGRCPDCARQRRSLERERMEFLESALASPALSPRFAEGVTARIEAERTAEGRRRLLGAARLLGAGLAVAGLVLAALLVGDWPQAGDGDAAKRAVVVKPAPALLGPGVGGWEDQKVNELDGWLADPSPIPVAARLALSDSIEFSAAFFRVEERLPCNRDVNRDGETNVSDAAYIFMLAMMPSPLAWDAAGEEIEIDCRSYCRI